MHVAVSLLESGCTTEAGPQMKAGGSTQCANRNRGLALRALRYATLLFQNTVYFCLYLSVYLTR